MQSLASGSSISSAAVECSRPAADAGGVLDEYFKNVSKLYELSRMNDMAIDRVRTEFLYDNKVYTQSELEELRRSNPKEERNGKARKRSRVNLSKQRLADQVATHESLKVMEDAVEETVTRPPESAHFLISHFFTLVSSGVIEQRLAEYTPAAQAHLIEEIKAGITLLEEFVSKNKTIEVNAVN